LLEHEVFPVIRPDETDLLLVTDVQRDFCSGGALAVPDGDAVVAPINALMERFPHTAATQDWHPAGHLSFASSHVGRRPFETIEVAYGRQVLWPDHCVQGTAGAGFHPDLHRETFELILRKGYHRSVDSYSAFVENDRVTSTGFAGYLQERGFRRLFFAGLALDYCVRFSAEDALRFEFEAVVVADACRAIDASRADAVLDELRHAGIQVVSSGDIPAGLAA
jgi:nicotinamidase/pyrazinamidase